MPVETDVWKEIETAINKTESDDETKNAIYKNLMKLKTQTINILIAGATGSGKSSTINALFGIDVAKVGYGVDPETMEIKKFLLENIILWDSPGFGDSPENDTKYARKIVSKLIEKDSEGNALIDLVLVIVDGSSRDMGTSYQIINEVVIPNMENKDRILVAINQCDIAKKGQSWNQATNQPESDLIAFLEEKVYSVKRRIFESTGVNIEPIFYSAYYKYNISKMLSFIIKHTPTEKRAVYINNINKDPDVWKSNDRKADYNKEIQEDLKISVIGGLKGAALGAASGAAIGSFIPVIGTTIGAIGGAILGFFGGLFG